MTVGGVGRPRQNTKYIALCLSDDKVSSFMASYHHHHHHHRCRFLANESLMAVAKRKTIVSLILVLIFSSLISDLRVVEANDTEIIVEDEEDSPNRTTSTNNHTVYDVDASNVINTSTTVFDNTTYPYEDDDTSNETDLHIDDFWDPTPSPPPSTRSRARAMNNDHSPPPPPTTSMAFTLPPGFTNVHRSSPFITNKPKHHMTTLLPGEENMDGIESENSIAENHNKIWKIVLHGTNMNSEELRLCNKSLIENHFRPSSRRKVARNLKSDLEKIFAKWNYKFSIVVSSTSRNTMGKALHGVWFSVSINGMHYFVAATHEVKDGPKIKEEQMSKIEYWAHVHAIGAQNMTGYRKYNRIATKLKADLDRFYGFGNVWSVIIVKNPLLVKAKIFEDPEYHTEFNRLNGGHFIVFRGGQNIEDGNRHARELLIPENDDETLGMDTEHEDYRNNIYLMT